ncbi:hypothetical protein N9C35_03060 [Flavobacteriaceae bacterium]|nr:hypothetical protein [Flavobacteriaceae bacterium]
MIKYFFTIILIFILTSCNYKVNKDLTNKDNIIFGRIRVYQLPSNKNEKLREISHLCVGSNYSIKPPGSKHSRDKTRIRFLPHGLFSIPVNDYYTYNSQGITIIDLLCQKNKIISNLGLNIKNIERHKLNYIGDIKIHFTSKPKSWHKTTITSCGYGGCSKKVITKHIYKPKKISINNNIKKDLSDIKKIILLPEISPIYNKPTQNNNAVKFTKNISKMPF